MAVELDWCVAVELDWCVAEEFGRLRHSLSRDKPS